MVSFTVIKDEKMNYSNLLVNNDQGICVITINRPDKLNALNKQTIKELSNALTDAEDDLKIGVVIITGAGEKAFVAGADISEFVHFSQEEGKQLSQEGQEKLFNVVENLSKPVIAAINGFALGGGLELALSSHIRLASESSRLGLPEVSLGIIPGYGGTQRLTQLVGKGKAFEMISTAEMISAQDAEKHKLVNYVVPQDQLIEKAKELAKKILKNSPQAISRSIRAINSGFQDQEDGFKTEIEEFSKCFGSADFIEGTKAFLEKRKPNFRN